MKLIQLYPIVSFSRMHSFELKTFLFFMGDGTKPLRLCLNNTVIRQMTLEGKNKMEKVAFFFFQTR